LTYSEPQVLIVNLHVVTRQSPHVLQTV